MNRRMFVVVALAGLLASGCSGKPSLPDYRYRLTVEVETPQGLRTGSSVIQVASHVSGKLALRAGDVTTQVKGEAVAVDLPGGKVLFALLSKPGSAEGANNYAFDALIPKPWVGWEEYVRDVNVLVGRDGVGVLAPADYPMLVTFADIRDPNSVARVDPTDFAPSFEPGVKLKRITVQMVDEPVTAGIEKRLGWLTDYRKRGARLNGSISIAIATNDLSDNLGTGSFSTEA